MSVRQQFIIEHHIHNEKNEKIEEYKIYVTVVNGKNMKCDI